MDSYIVRCECDPEAPVGYITDGRDTGGRVRVRYPPAAQGESVRALSTKRGDRRGPVLLQCPQCRLGVLLVDSTVAEIVDRVAQPAPGTGKSLREEWGATAIPYNEPVDWEARREEVLMELQGERDGALPSKVPTVTRYSLVYLVPLKSLREIVSRLPKRRT